MIHAMPWCHVAVCGGDWFNLWLNHVGGVVDAQQVCSLTLHQESYQSDSGQLRLLKPLIVQTHTQHTIQMSKKLKGFLNPFGSRGKGL